jgi:hypothetical protein
MASTKAKKVNEYQSEKQRQAQMVNMQKAKNERMFALLGLRHLYPLLNEYGKIALARVRISATLIEAAPGCDNAHAKEAVEYIKGAFKSFEMNSEVTLLNGNKITVRDFRTTLTSIFLNFISEKYDVGPHTPQIKKEVCDLFLKYVDTWKGVNELCEDFFDDVCTHISSLKYGIYYPKEGLRGSHNNGSNGSWSTVPLFTFNVEIPKRKTANIEGKKREVYQMGFPEFDKGVRWTTVASERLGLAHGQCYPCYIQQHAIKRLVERIGIFSESVTVFQACLSLEQGRVLRIPGSDAYHIEFKILDIKLGYLVAILVDDILVVKTFIFVTQSGSPEGKRIETATGIKKVDKDYIGMGTLKGFLSEDVAKSPKMALLLEKVGCADLLKAYDVFSQKVNIKGMQSTGRIITQYLEKTWEYSNLESIESYTSDYLAIVPVLPPEPIPEPITVAEEDFEEEEEQEELVVPAPATETLTKKQISKKKRIMGLMILPLLIPLLLVLNLLIWILNGFKPIKKEKNSNGNVK